jgi:hypothetical protein
MGFRITGRRNTLMNASLRRGFLAADRDRLALGL